MSLVMSMVIFAVHSSHLNRISWDNINKRGMEEKGQARKRPNLIKLNTDAFNPIDRKSMAQL
jgi:hypothetical protein